jgi:hypothetical protein
MIKSDENQIRGSVKAIGSSKPNISFLKCHDPFLR